ncbi:MAG: hypothetical protein MJ089_00930 [Ruminococcus sp.]|nr:hypothetical protein [Ruminococcus sp.]
MTKTVKKRLKIALVLNILIVILEFIGLIIAIGRYGSELTVFYTNDSNICSLIASAIFIPFLVKAIQKEDANVIPRWVSLLKFLIVTCLAVTFLIVITVLAPTHEDGYVHMLFKYDLLYFHTLCPILSIVSFIFFEPIHNYNIKHSIIGTAPTLLYAIIAVILNITKVIYGPYPFLHVYEQSIIMSVIWFAVILFLAFIVNLILRLLNRKLSGAEYKKNK